MEGQKVLLLTLQGCVTDISAQTAAARIRAAISNGVQSVTLVCAPNLEFSSGEFMGFLAVTAERLGVAENRGILWENPPQRLLDLLAVMGLKSLFSYRQSATNN